jgi:hypothetical protein
MGQSLPKGDLQDKNSLTLELYRTSDVWMDILYTKLMCINDKSYI